MKKKVVHYLNTIIPVPKHMKAEHSSGKSHTVALTRLLAHFRSC